MRERRPRRPARPPGAQGHDAAGVHAKFGVRPESIPDYLALVGDSSDGFPGLPGWGAKSAATVLDRFGHLEAIPDRSAAWDVPVRSAAALAQTLAQQRDLALLFRDLATLRTSAPTFSTPEDLRWRGPTREFDALCRRIEAGALPRRARDLARGRGMPENAGRGYEANGRVSGSGA